MIQLPLENLEDIMRELSVSQKRVKVLWQESESLAFVARGREYRSEFHINESDEFTYMIKGRMNPGLGELHAGAHATFSTVSARRFCPHRRSTPTCG
jgi:hypothetical protein